MAKKNNKVEDEKLKSASTEKTQVAVEDKKSKKSAQIENNQAENSKNQKVEKVKKKKEKKASLFKKMKETTSELKKVSWPSFGKVVKQTGVVILVVTICTLLLFGIDKLFSLIYNVLTK